MYLPIKEFIVIAAFAGGEFGDSEPFETEKRCDNYREYVIEFYKVKKKPMNFVACHDNSLNVMAED
jgi:hypothetical protein